MPSRPNPTLSRRLRSVVSAAITAVLVAPVCLVAQADLEPRGPAIRATTLGVDYSYAYFQGDLDPWHLGALSLGHRRAAGSLIGRLNVARRFAQSGTQFEVDAYPGLGKGAYGYLNAGYSPSTVFPDWRFGGEYFRSLPRAYEASLGFRLLRFDGAPVTLFTGSVGRYTGNYWLSLRPYVRDKSSGISASASLTARRYRADADNYVGGRLGFGSTPGDDAFSNEQLTRTSSATAGLHGSRSMRVRTIGTWSLAYEREELSLGRVRNRWEVSGGLKYRF